MIDDVSYRLRGALASRFGCTQGIVSQSAPDDASGGYLYIPEGDSLETPSRILTIADFAATNASEAREASLAIIASIRDRFVAEGVAINVFDLLASAPTHAYYDVSAAETRKIGALFPLGSQVYAISLQVNGSALASDDDVAAMRATLQVSEDDA